MSSKLQQQYSRRNKKLRRLGYKSYQQYLEGAEWSTIRRLIWTKRKNGSVFWNHCWICDWEENLHIHHVSYTKVHKPRIQAMVMLCVHCHKWVHQVHRENPNWAVGKATAEVKKLNDSIEAEQDYPSHTFSF